MRHSFFHFFILLLLIGGRLQAEEYPANAAIREKREKAFTQLLSNVELIGTYTQQGSPKGPEKERYTIYRVTKISGQKHLWRFDVRMQFGSVDLRVPLPLTVRWAQDTPMVILNDTKIPGLGTFSAKVFFDKTRYAGTWQHGSEGGHLFGNIIGRKLDIERKPVER